MVQLIDKASVVSKIENRIKGLKDCHADTVEGYAGEIFGLKTLLSFLNTLEVKEVDLDKSLTSFMGRYAYENGGEYPSAIDIAKHFFELGLKAQKGG